MDKLSTYPVDLGQPLRSTDWDLIQGQSKMGFAATIQSLIGDNTQCILSGLVRQHVDATFEFSEGYVYAFGEIFHVPAATTSDNKFHFFYVQEVIATQESRTFQDASIHDVWEMRSMAIGEDPAAIPPGAIAYSDLLTLIQILEADILSKVPGGEVSPVTELNHSFNFATHDLAQGALLLAAPGDGKIVRIIHCSAKITVTTKIECGNQQLNLAYGNDATSPDIGYFPNSFLESVKTNWLEMKPGSGYMAENTAIIVGLSGEADASAGNATIVLYCLYQILDV